MNCHSVKKHLPSYIDQTVTTALSESITTHINNCPVCAHEVQTERNLLALLHSSEYPHLSDAAWTSIHTAVMRQLPSLPKKQFKLFKPHFAHSRFTLSPVRAVAALFIFSAISALLFFSLRSNKSLLTANAKDSYPKVVAIKGMAFTANETPVKNYFSILPGHSIHTDSNSNVAIKIDTSSALNLGKNTMCGVKQYATNKAVFALSRGDLNAKVSKRKHNQLFRIETPNAFCEVIGTQFDVSTQRDPFSQSHLTTLVVHEGTVKFGSPNKSVYVKAGNAIALFGDSLGEQLPENDPLIAHLKNNPGKGQISLTSEPSGAKVFIDAHLIGVTPLQTTIDCGIHSIRLSKADFSDWRDTLTISAYSNVSKFTSLSKQSETVSVDTEAASAVTTTMQATLKLINKGMYTEAITQLTGLVNNPSTSQDLKATAYQKLSICYQNIGDINSALSTLNTIILGSFPTESKGTALFERATLYRSSLHNVELAMNDLEEYTHDYQKGIWAEEAMLSLAQLQQLSGLHQKAAVTYQKFCNTYKQSVHYEKALYTLATMYSGHLTDYAKAVGIYNRLLQEQPKSVYVEDALFWRADCLLNLGHISKAHEAFTTYIEKYPQGKWASETKTRVHKIETVEVQ